jgi:hypothetical protein
MPRWAAHRFQALSLAVLSLVRLLLWRRTSQSEKWRATRP